MSHYDRRVVKRLVETMYDDMHAEWAADLATQAPERERDS